MESEHLKNILESLLFVASQPLKAKELAKFLEEDEAAVHAALDQLVAERRDDGVVVLENSGEYQMATQPKNSTQVKNFLNAELREKLTDATVEVLAIIAYRQPISKAEIEAIRGVNSQYSIRHLLMRGLIEKIQNPHDARSFLYQTTTEFLEHMGLVSTKDLPEFEKLVESIKLPETPQAQEAMDSPEQPLAAALDATPEDSTKTTAEEPTTEPQQPPVDTATEAQASETEIGASEPDQPSPEAETSVIQETQVIGPVIESTIITEKPAASDFDPVEIAEAQEEFADDEEDEFGDEDEDEE